MKNELKTIFDKYLFNDKSINYNDTAENIIDNVTKIIDNKIQYVEDVEMFQFDLLHYKKSQDLKDLNNNDKFKIERQKILENLNCTEDEEYFYHFSPIDIITAKVCDSYGNDRICCLNDVQIKEIKRLGYQVTQTKMLKNKKIISVYCEGKHPNVNPENKEYCISDYFFNSDLTFENVSLILSSLSNMTVNGEDYLNAFETNDIYSIILRNEGD